MKDKILMLIIGILIGAIIASGCFLLFGKNNDKLDEKMNGRDFDTNMINGEKMKGTFNRGGNNTEESTVNVEENSTT